MGTPAELPPDGVLLAGRGAGDASLAIALVRRFRRTAFDAAKTRTGYGMRKLRGPP